MNIQRLDAGDHATNNLTAWLVIAGFLDQEMLVPDVTVSVIKPEILPFCRSTSLAINLALMKMNNNKTVFLISIC